MAKTTDHAVAFIAATRAHASRQASGATARGVARSCRSLLEMGNEIRQYGVLSR